MPSLRRHILTAAALQAVLLAALAPPSLAGGEPTFVVTFEPAARSEPFTGRVYVFLGRGGKEPRQGPDWFKPAPFFARDVSDWRPGEPMRFTAGDPAVLSFPKEVATSSLEGYSAQAVARFNPLDPVVGEGIGNGFSAVLPVNDAEGPATLAIDQIVRERPFEETRWGKLLAVPSHLLSEFHQRNATVRATILLPASYYSEPDRRYPTIFTIPGFGGDHRRIGGGRTIDPVHEPIPEQNERGVEFLRVMLDPSCPLGHHVFADSANNGPVGEALVSEFLPAFDRAFRSIPAPTARFLSGHSSGGWSSLWLQIAYAETFGGVWSTAPDPVDFRDFQEIDLYRTGENMYVDSEGNERPIARPRGGEVVTFRSFDDMEQVLGPGGQLHSFEAVFSPKGENGRPQPLWNRGSGDIDETVAEAWKRYDIRLRLEENWPALRAKLAGRIHVIMGEEDTFLLEGATRLLRDCLTKLGSNAVVELVPGRDHFSLLTPELRGRMRAEMTTAFLKNHPNGR